MKNCQLSPTCRRCFSQHQHYQLQSQQIFELPFLKARVTSINSSPKWVRQWASERQVSAWSYPGPIKISLIHIVVILSNPRYAFAKLLSAGKLNSRRRLKEASGSNTKKVRQMWKHPSLILISRYSSLKQTLQTEVTTLYLTRPALSLPQAIIYSFKVCFQLKTSSKRWVPKSAVHMKDITRGSDFRAKEWKRLGSWKPRIVCLCTIRIG